MNKESSENRKRIPKFKLSDKDLIDMILKTKNKFQNQVITCTLLEKETGIGRNTWNHRTKKYIDEINILPLNKGVNLE